MATKTGYHWTIGGLPFFATGLVMFGERVILKVEFEDQDEKLLVRRLASITRSMKRIDTELNRQPTP